jgi:Flp pilus assembly protein TadG
MNAMRSRCFQVAFKDQRGQVLPWMALLMVLFLGCAGLTIDLGRAYVSYRELQASTDAATLAGAYGMTVGGATTTSVTALVKQYSSLQSGAGTGNGVGVNANSNLGTVSLAAPSFSCVTNSNFVEVPCSASPLNDNVLQVTQTAVVPMYFIEAISLFGNNAATSITLRSTSTAAIESGQNTPLNLAIVLDTTASMNDTDDDANCGHSELYCALQGVQTLLTSLSPCSVGSTSGNCLGAYDQVSLFTFPNIQANDASDDTTCPTSNPTIPSYSYYPIPSTSNTSYTAPSGTTASYQVTGFLSDYSSTNQQNGALSSGSALGIAAGASTSKNCGGLQAPGGDGTFLAGAMYQAMTSLQVAAAANANAKNAIIVLSDGGANSTKFGSGFSSTASTYPSKVDQCTQTVAAGQYATTLGITVYTVAYGASQNNSDCSTDSGKYAITPCTELANAASNLTDFYSDATAQENKGACTSADNPNLNLQGIFQSIANRFTAARLIPNTV